jgi:hypothetical protein
MTKTETAGTTQDLLDAGFVRQENGDWKHAKGLLYKDQSFGYWYFRANNAPPKLMHRTLLKLAIPKAVEAVK